MKIRINWSKLIYKSIKWFFLGILIGICLLGLVALEVCVWNDFKWEGLGWLNGSILGCALVVAGIVYLVVHENEYDRHTPILRIENSGTSWRERRRIRKEARRTALQELRERELERARNAIHLESEVIE
jgi:hypothetical protein